MSSPHITLTGISPKFTGLRWESGSCLRIGRLEYMEVILNHASVSRRHAEIILATEGWVIQDQGSSNGTYLNDVRVGRTAQKLRAGDVIRCGEIVLRVETLVEPVTVPVALPSQEPTPVPTSRVLVRVKAVSENSWEDAVQHLDKSEELVHAPQQRLLALMRAGYHLCHSHGLDDLLQAILDDAVRVLQAQRGCIVLVDEFTGQFQLRVTSSVNGSDAQKVFSRTLIRRSFEQGQSLLCQEAQADQELRQTGTVNLGAMGSIICTLLRTPRKRLGVLHLDRSTGQSPFTREDLQLADAMAACVSTGIESAQLIETQREAAVHTVTALAQAVELRDQYTGGHTQRVTTYALLLAEELGLTLSEQRQLKIGTPLHDIGKIGIHDEVLRKPGRLTTDEFEHMKTHTLKGAAILETIPTLAGLIPIVRSHHERWDGRGYPDGLSGEQISRLARVVAVADAFDAMTSDRPYRPAMQLERAFNEIIIKAGTHFDPECAAAFLRLRPDVERILALERSQRAYRDRAMQTLSHNDLVIQAEREGIILDAMRPGRNLP